MDKTRRAAAGTVVVLLLMADACLGAEEKNVLVLNSYHRGYTWTDDMVEGIEQAILEQVENVELRVEYMDTKRIHSEEYQRDLFRLLKRKLSGVKLDVAILTDDNAFHFIRKYREELLGECPVVFLGVNYFDEPMLRGHEQYITGIIQDGDIPATVRTALTLEPDTRQIAFIFDNTSTGRSYREQVLLASAEFPDLEITHLDGKVLSTAELHAACVPFLTQALRSYVSG